MTVLRYKAKCIEDGKWYEGSLLRYEDGRARIIPTGTDIFCLEKDDRVIQVVAPYVAPESICLCTEVADKNGNLIYENDYFRIDLYDENVENIAVIVFNNGAFFVEWYGDTGEVVLDKDNNKTVLYECIDTNSWDDEEHIITESEIAGNIIDGYPAEGMK